MSRRFRRLPIYLILCIGLLSILGFIPTLQAQSAGDFTIVVLPDTQNYSQTYPQIFDSQTQWVASNAAAQNIKLVIGEGDTVNISSNATQWANAVHSIGILDQAQIPYALAIGNHDYDTLPPTNRKATLFNQYFGPSRYSGKPYYGATEGFLNHLLAGTNDTSSLHRTRPKCYRRYPLALMGSICRTRSQVPKKSFSQSL